MARRLGAGAAAAALLMAHGTALWAAPVGAAPGPASTAVGATSPLADCRSAAGCIRAAPADFPLLYVQFLSGRALTLGFAGHEAGDYASARLMTSAGQSGHAAIRLGWSRTVVGFDEDDRERVERRLHVLLDRPLEAGQRYRIELNGDEARTAGVEFEMPAEPVSPSLQLNQVGYLPRAAKSAYVGNWLGTAGPMPVDASGFEVVDEDTGQIELRGALVQIATKDEWSGNDVYRADFSALTRAGNFRLHVPGIGRSRAFRISERVFEPVYRRLVRLFYHARNSTPVAAPWADPGRERPGGIPDHYNALVHPSVGSSPLGRREKAYAYRAVRRGWFDAGDYGQYVVNAAPVWFAFGAGMDLSPTAFAGDDLGIPESGNGVPDVLDELEWGMDWLLGMQDAADGGVFCRVAPVEWDTSLPHTVDKPRFLFEKTTHATASFAAAAALHARLIRPWRPERARAVLSAAERAWKFIERTAQWPAEGDRYRNPPGVHAGEYPDTSASDNRLWAAAELYRATGEARYLDAFRALFATTEPDPTANVSFRQQGLAAYWAMYRALSSEGSVRLNDDDDMAGTIRDTLLSAADWRLRKAAEHPFGAPMHQHKPFTGWGSFAHAPRAVIPLLQAWAISGDAAYRDAAAVMTDPQLGANPQGLSYITGIGTRSVKFPLSKLDRYQQSDDPIIGLPVNGPHYHLPALWPSTRAVNDAYVPPANSGDYPALRRYVDARPLPPMAEATVAEYAALAVAYGLLANGKRLFGSGR